MIGLIEILLIIHLLSKLNLKINNRFWVVFEMFSIIVPAFGRDNDASKIRLK